VSLIIVVSDSAALRQEVIATIARPEYEILEASSGQVALDLAHAHEVDLVISDLQMSNMGGMAVTLELRLEASYDNLAPVPVLLLLDRRADVLLARRSGAEGFVIKPIDPLRLRRATAALLEGGRYEDSSYQPTALPADLVRGA